MKVELNFKADEPTLNGHIYPKDVLKKAFDEKFKNKNVFVTTSHTRGILDLEKIVGLSNGYEMLPGGEILLDIKILDTPMGKIYKKLGSEFNVTISGVGTIDEKTKTIQDDFILSHFFIIREK